MTVEFSSTVPVPVDGVFAWHERPGALTRLTPPWLPVRVVREATSIRDGQAELRLPGGLRWVAAHDPGEYQPPHRFADELTSRPLSLATRWRHTHLFEPHGADATRVIDRVDATAPGRVLRPMLGYRHRILAADLAAHARIRATAGNDALTVAVTGASGLIGSTLCALLSTAGHRVIRLVRGTPTHEDERPWRPNGPADNLLDGVDAVVHLAGKPLAGRFTARHMSEVRESRIGPTKRLAVLAARAGVRTMVTASGIGYYGYHRGDERLSEGSDPGDGFLAGVVADWEAATKPAEEAGVRVVHLRTGVVQSPRGGTLQLFRPLFAAGVGGPLGDGSQWLSWIGIDDIADVYHRALVDTRLSGPVNAVAPNPVRSAEYARTLGRVMHRPAMLPVPDFGPRLVVGKEGARDLANASQHVLPTKLTEIGHEFRHTDLEPALRHVLGRT